MNRTSTVTASWPGSRAALWRPAGGTPPLRGPVVILLTFSGLLLTLVIIGISPLMAVALMSLLVLGISVLARPPLALLLLFIGAGLPSLLIPFPGHTIRLVEPALLLALLAILFKRPGLRLRLPHLFMVLFVVIGCISFFHVPQISTDLNAYAADKRLYELLLISIAFFCGTALISSIKNVSSVLVVILLCNIPLYLIALAQALKIPLPPFLEVSGAQIPALADGRLWGPTSGAATFGLYLVNLFIVALICWAHGGRKRNQIIGAMMTIVTALAIIGSGTRSAAVAAAITAVVFLLLTRRFKLLLVMVLVVGILGVIFQDKILPLFAHDSSSITNRFFLWEEAMALIVSHPWIGIGLQQFPMYYAQLIVSPATTLNQHGISIHNQYLEFAVESGIAWLLVGVLLMLSCISTCWQAYRRAPRKHQGLLLAAALAMLATMITSFVDVPLDKTEVAIFLFLLVGMAVGYAERFRPRIPVKADLACPPHPPAGTTLSCPPANVANIQGAVASSPSGLLRKRYI